MTPSDTHDVCLPSGGLPTTAFEEHMLADDRRSHPMVIVARFSFTGQAPREALEAAFATVLRCEPLLTARIDPRGFGRPRWIPGPIPTLGYSRCFEAPPLATVLVPRIDPFVGPMVHAHVLEHPTGWFLDVAVHHAACDGLGFVAFMERWFLEAAGLEGRRPRPAADVLACLLARGRIAPSWTAFFRLLPDLKVGLAGVKQFVSRRVVEIGTRQPRGNDDHDGKWRPAILVTEVAPAIAAHAEKTARALGVSVNDVLAGAFVTAISESAEEHHEAPAGDGWIRLGVPMSLRTKSDHMLPAANRVSMVFLDRQREDCVDGATLASGIHAEMELIRSHSLGHIMPMSLEIGRLMPGGLRRSVKRSAPQATAVLSNLGRCFHRSPLADASDAIRLSSSTLESWWIVPPVRPGTAIAVATHETGGRRMVAAHLDQTALAPATVQSILDRFVARISSLAPAPSDPGPVAIEADA